MSPKHGRKIFSNFLYAKKTASVQNYSNYAFHSVPQQKTVIYVSLNFIFETSLISQKHSPLVFFRRSNERHFHFKTTFLSVQSQSFQSWLYF